MSESETARVIAPPPLIYLAGIGTGLAVDWIFALQPVPLALPIRIGVAVLAAAAGLALVGLALRRFRTVGTAAEPWKPSSALALGGVYRVTRNPMYLGMALVMLALAVGLASLGTLLTVPLTMLVIDRFVIVREERYLEARFGEPYSSYRKQVRRWI